MMKSLVFLAILMHAFGFFNPTQYLHMCDGLNTSESYCYTLWNNSGLPLNFRQIEQWTSFSPYMTTTNFSIGFAQAHAMAATWQLWLNQHSSGMVYGFTKFTESTFIYQDLNSQTFVDCSAPILQDSFLNSISHVPFLNVDPPIPIYDSTIMPFNPYDWQDWCNIDKLNSINLNGAVSYSFNAYYTIYSGGLNVGEIGGALTAFGISLVSIPHDIAIADESAYYSDGIYRPGTPIYFYPANVVGVWAPNNNGTVFLLCYCFGALNVATNYLWVDLSLISIPNVMTFIAPFWY